MKKYTLAEYIETTIAVLEDLRSEEKKIHLLAEHIAHCLRSGNKVIFCGNGGSAADAQHLSAELMGRFLKDRKPMAALSLTVDTSALTAIGNDYGYDEVFARQLEGIGNVGDVVICMSTSGNSKNVVRCASFATQNGMFVAGMTGQSVGALGEFCNLTFKVKSSETNVIQEAHQILGHFLCKLVEDIVCPAK